MWGVVEVNAYFTKVLRDLWGIWEAYPYIIDMTYTAFVALGAYWNEKRHYILSQSIRKSYAKNVPNQSGN